MVHPDHYQFYLEDSAIPHDTSQLWRPSPYADRLDVLPGLIAVATARYGGDVPVEVTVLAGEPEAERLDGWDHVAECSLRVESQRVWLTSPDSFGPSAPS